MTVQIIPLQPIASQTVSVTVNGQPCAINVYERSTGLFIDVIPDGSSPIYGVQGLNGTPVFRDAYFGFTGDFAFIDTEGSDDPQSSGLGSRWQLAYVSP